MPLHPPCATPSFPLAELVFRRGVHQTCYTSLIFFFFLKHNHEQSMNTLFKSFPQTKSDPHRGYHGAVSGHHRGMAGIPQGPARDMAGMAPIRRKVIHSWAKWPKVIHSFLFDHNFVICKLSRSERLSDCCRAIPPIWALDMLEGYSVGKVNGKFHVYHNEKHVATIVPTGRDYPRCYFDWHGQGLWRFRASDFVVI
jgi:hypothetical protein